MFEENSALRPSGTWRETAREIVEIIRHPVRALTEEWRVPRTRPSLFHYGEEGRERTAIEWKELIRDLATGHRFALWIPSLWSDPANLAEQRAELRARRMEAASISMAVHALAVGCSVFLALGRPVELLPQRKDAVVFIKSPMNLPDLGAGRAGGGGGGGGGNESLPPSGGRLPDAAPLTLMPPDPGAPRPLVPGENLLAVSPGIQIPFDLPQDSSLPIGDIMAPLGGATSSGPGTGQGIGTGDGPGIGSGRGPGAGSGDNGGIGSGHDRGIGNDRGPYFGGKDLIVPEAICKPAPLYTEEARKNRIEGMVVLQVTITAGGAVSGVKIMQGLGHGLDESAVHTITSQWKFRPATYRGVPIDFAALIEVTFRLY